MKTPYFLRTLGAAALFVGVCQSAALAQAPGPGQKWAATWSSSMQTALTTYTPPAPATPPATIATANIQPDLTFPFPNINTDGANNQTLRLIVKPDLWGKTMRFRFSNFFGTKLVTFSKVTVAVQDYAANLLPSTLVNVTFNGGQTSLTVQPGQLAYSDPVILPFDTADPLIQDRNLAVSFAVQGTSGPMTYHSGAHNTNYVTGSGTGDHTSDADGFAYDYTTTSFYFLDAIDVVAPSNTVVVCAFGDSITDGTHTTLNGNDRWSNVLSRRLHGAYGNQVSVVNAGIGGNRVVPPAGTGPAATLRLDRDVIGLSGLTHVVWMEGINDIGGGQSTANIIAGYKNVVDRLRSVGVKVVGGTVVSALSNATHGLGPGDVQRKALNDYIRTAGNFDAVADFDAVTIDPATGNLLARFLPNSEFTQLPWDYLHPNHAGYNAMGQAVPLGIFAPPPVFTNGQSPGGTPAN